MPLQEGPLETGPLQTGPSQTTSQKAKPRQTALQKRAKHPEPAGRQITVHARPSYLTAGTQVPVGSVGNGYVYDTFNQATPIEGTFSGMRGRERLTDQFGNAGARADAVQVLAPARGRRSGRGEQRLDRNLKSGRIEPRDAARQHPRLDRVALAALVVDDDAALGIENEIMLDARQREIAAELAAVVDRRGAWATGLRRR